MWLRPVRSSEQASRICTATLELTVLLRNPIAHCLMLVAWLASGQALAAQKETYNTMAHIQIAPNAPFGPTTADECNRYEKSWTTLIADVHEAHEACLRVETGKTFGVLPADPADKCSNPACQKYHTARREYQSTATERVQSCRVSLSKYEAQMKKEAEAKFDRRVRDSQANPCIGRWEQQKGLCTGPAANRDDAKNCQRSLDQLRRDCPKDMN